MNWIEFYDIHKHIMKETKTISTLVINRRLIWVITKLTSAANDLISGRQKLWESSESSTCVVAAETPLGGTEGGGGRRRSRPAKKEAESGKSHWSASWARKQQRISPTFVRFVAKTTKTFQQCENHIQISDLLLRSCGSGCLISQKSSGQRPEWGGSFAAAVVCTQTLTGGYKEKLSCADRRYDHRLAPWKKTQAAASILVGNRNWSIGRLWPTKPPNVLQNCSQKTHLWTFEARSQDVVM